MTLCLVVVASGCDDGLAPLADASLDSGQDAENDVDVDVDVEPDGDGDSDGDSDSDSDADGDSDGDSDSDSDEDLGEEGSWDRPIEVDSLPFAFEGDTRAAPSVEADAYSPCASGTDESGGEYVFVVEIADPGGRLRLELDDEPGDGVDVDIHLLEDSDPTSCVARDNIAIERTVEPGSWWFVVDTWVNGDGVALAGPFSLWVTLEPADTGDCLTSPIECDERDTPTPNGVPTETPGVGGCPDGMVPVADFCIDRYEALLVEVLPDGTPGPWSPYLNPGSRRVMALSVEGAIPQGYINGEQAAAACVEAGKRLCTDEEWLLACRGDAGRIFPNGDDHDTGACNVTRACHPAIQYFESAADWVWSELGHPCINQLPDGLAGAGEFARCVTPENVFDLVGNLHEWTADPAGTFRGGFYVDAEINGRGCLYRTTAHNIYHWDYSTGFRCCSD